MFSRDHFQLILTRGIIAVHGAPGYDPCEKFQPLTEHADGDLRYHYTHQQLSVEGSPVGTDSGVLRGVWGVQTPPEIPKF
jgi:hypothetical protein